MDKKQCETNLRKNGYSEEYSKGWCDRNAQKPITSVEVHPTKLILHNPPYTKIMSIIIILILLGFWAIFLR